MDQGPLQGGIGGNGGDRFRVYDAPLSSVGKKVAICAKRIRFMPIEKGIMGAPN